MRALRSAFALKLDDVHIARFGQRVENEFVGAQVGIMDPMAASLADQCTALFLDARTLEFERVPLPAEADLIVLVSGISHQHSAGDYNTRRAECEKACALLGNPATPRLIHPRPRSGSVSSRAAWLPNSPRDH
jgi:galactokinase